MNNYNIIKSKVERTQNKHILKSFVICETGIFDWTTAMGFSKKYYKNLEPDEEVEVVQDKILNVWKNKGIPYTVLKIVKRG